MPTPVAEGVHTEDEASTVGAAAPSRIRLLYCSSCWAARSRHACCDSLGGLAEIDHALAWPDDVFPPSVEVGALAGGAGQPGTISLTTRHRETVPSTTLPD
jgi:hypothetical protein